MPMQSVFALYQLFTPEDGFIFEKMKTDASVKEKKDATNRLYVKMREL